MACKGTQLEQGRECARESRGVWVEEKGNEGEED